MATVLSEKRPSGTKTPSAFTSGAMPTLTSSWSFGDMAGYEAASRRRNAPGARALRRRRRMIWFGKRVLPVTAILLLGLIAIWPELQRAEEHGRFTFRRLAAVEQGSGQMIDPSYRGLDSRGRPYLVTAKTARQQGEERINLASPKGDVTLQNGMWLMASSDTGVYMQHIGTLDLSGDVTLYRQDGTTLTTDSATIDMKQGAANSTERTHVEGPFGVLDGQGFTALDKGGVIQMQGPARLVMNGANR